MLPLEISDDRFLIRNAESRPQSVVLRGLEQHPLYTTPYLKLAGHPTGCMLYYLTRCNFYWPAIVDDCYTKVGRCPQCERNRIKLRKEEPRAIFNFSLQLPQGSGSIDTLGEFIGTMKGNQYLLVITNRLTKIVKTIPMQGGSAVEVARYVVHTGYLTMAHRGACWLITAAHALRGSSKSCGKLMNIHKSYTTTYHPQENDLVERYNCTILAASRMYVVNHSRSWEQYANALK